MGLLRRTFTRDVEMAAVQRLETGASIAEVARAFEVNPNVLHRWRREFRQGPGNAFPGSSFSRVRGLCHEASIRPVAQSNRSLA